MSVTVCLSLSLNSLCQTFSARVLFLRLLPYTTRSRVSLSQIPKEKGSCQSRFSAPSESRVLLTLFSCPDAGSGPRSWRKAWLCHRGLRPGPSHLPRAPASGAQPASLLTIAPVAFARQCLLFSNKTKHNDSFQCMDSSSDTLNILVPGTANSLKGLSPCDALNF